MSKKIFLFSLVVLICVWAPFVYAGRVELTTYYPSPYGEYKNLSSTEDASFATTKGGVIIGTLNPGTTPEALATDNTLTLQPVAGGVDAQTGGGAGSLRYSSAEGGFVYNDGTNWRNFSGGGAVYCVYSSAVTQYPWVLGTPRVDVTGMTMTKNFKAGNIIAEFSCGRFSFVGGGGGLANPGVLLLIDGTPSASWYSWGSTGTLSLRYAGPITAGSHTIKVQYDPAGTGATVELEGLKVLTAMESQ